MHQSQQQSSFTYLPQSSNPIPNPLSSYPQPPPTHPSHQQFLYPPGTDPYAHQPQFASTHVGFAVNTQFYEDPNGASQNWVTTQADHSSVVALNSIDGSNQLVDNLASAPNQSGQVQPMRCDVCNIECNTKDVYDKHISGKKHRRNLQEKISSTIAVFPESSNAMIFGASGVVNAQELERKKQKLLSSGAAVNSVRICTICNVACNSLEVFAKHLSGRRHAAQAGLIAIDGIGPYLAVLRANDQFWNKGKKTTKIVQSSWCDVCQINCNINDAYAHHLSGKKHLTNLENLEKSKHGTLDPSMGTPAGTNMMIKPVENPAANVSHGVINVQYPVAAQPEASKEDLETKKRKVLEGGAAAAAVRVCTICNVVCNSQKVFEFHLTGQKHAAAVKKQADSRIATITA